MHYATVTPSAPLLQKAGDIVASANLSTGVGLTGSAAVALSDRLSVLLEGSYLGASDDTSIFQRYNSLGLGLGTHMRYGERFRGDTFLGYARGSSTFDGYGGPYSSSEDSGHAEFDSYFAQSAIAVQLDDDDDDRFLNDEVSVFAGYQLRLSYLHFRNYLFLDQRYNEPGFQELFLSHNDVLISEHSFFLRALFDFIALFGFVTFPKALTPTQEGPYNDPFAFGLGIELRLSGDR
jgi:hypothetical protein